MIGYIHFCGENRSFCPSPCGMVNLSFGVRLQRTLLANASETSAASTVHLLRGLIRGVVNTVGAEMGTEWGVWTSRRICGACSDDGQYFGV